ncbi:hypothetical protein GPECTOR_4g995 [Gonium pectorale]|uniref:Uncharacterized protein n=1 Tax=Gonium pectorale TaxID=33097 RepID=A0A150GYU5_GONPE|nr:hypothetical protein GPECTOR_4g995 [Gonium pectorale]|eukprot:KXZ54923.1 hypothetical protein GPECTOR_4g995 [Gonium pectorale]
MVAEVVIGRNVDSVHLDLVTPFNKQRASPQHHILVDWIKNQELREADAALAQSKLSLMEFLEGQAEAAATAGRTGAANSAGNGGGGAAAASRGGGSPGPGTSGTAGNVVVDVGRLARLDTSGAATLAMLTEVASPRPSSSSGFGGPSSHGGAGGAGASRGGSPRSLAGTTDPTGPSAASSQSGDGEVSPRGNGLPSGPGRPPGTAESASTDVSEFPESFSTLAQHLQHFNACVASLQMHLGPNFGVYFHVTPAACAVKGRCAHVRLMRHPYPAKLAAAATAGQSLEGAGRSAAQQAAARYGRQWAASAAAVRAEAHGGAGGGDSADPAAAAPPPPGSAAAIFGGEATPATLVDIVYSGMTDLLLRAERSVAVVGNELARLFEKYEPPLSLIEEPKQCRKLKTLPVAREYVEANRRIQALNAVLFKLAKAAAKTAWIYSTPLSLPDGSLGDVAHMVCEAVRRVADTTWVMCKRQLDSVHLVALLTHYEPFTITPRLVNDETTFRFELEVIVDQALLITQSFPDFLPPQMRAVWDSLLALAAVVQESRNSLGPLREQYKRLHDEAAEFYTLAPEASKQRRLGLADATSVARIVNANLALVYEAQQARGRNGAAARVDGAKVDGAGSDSRKLSVRDVFTAYERNIQRIIDAYSRAQKEVKADLQQKLAELQTKLPRSLLKPSFAPEMLHLARATVNPTELAATMTLALTAPNMDPSSLAIMQQSLALNALGAQGQGLAMNAAAAAAVNSGAGGAPGTVTVGGGALATLTELGALQQQQQMQLLQMQQMQALQMQQAAAAYGMYGMAGLPGAAGAAAAAGATTAGVAADPQIAAHGTSPDYAAQMAMAQAYGYGGFGNPYGMPADMFTPVDAVSAAAGGVNGTGQHAAPAAGSSGSAPAVAGSSAAGAAAGANGLANAYQSAGYDANTIAMLARMGYGGFAAGSAAALQQQTALQTVAVPSAVAQTAARTL